MSSGVVARNVYPKTHRAVLKQIKDDFGRLMALAKYQRTELEKDDKWADKATKFNDAMCYHA